MTSKLIVNELAADTGISTITVGDNMSGVTFKTGTSNLHNVGIEIAGINVLGADTPIGVGATIYNSGDVLVGGAVTATKFYGDGSALTGITDQTVTINNQADNRVITGTGATNTLNGESTLTYDGTTLFCNGGTITAERGAIPSVEAKNSTTSSYARFYCSQTSGSGGYAAFQKLGTTSTAIGGANATQIWCTGDAPLVFGVNGGERLRITSGGAIQNHYNTNLPVTDSRPILQLGYGVVGDDSAGRNNVSTNAYPVNGNSTWHYIGSSSLKAARYDCGFGEHKWYTAVAGTRGNDITWLEKFKINEGYTGTVDVKGIPAHLRLYSQRDTSDWDNTDPIGKLDFYVGDDTTNNLPYTAGFIHCLNETDNANEPSGALVFGTTTANLSGGAIERLRITNTGKVGIGTLSPDRDLEVFNAGSQTSIGIQGGSNTAQCSLWFMKPGDGNIGGIYYTHGSTNTQGMYFRVNDQQIADIKGTGILRVSNTIAGAGHTAAVHIFKASGSNDDHAELAVGYDSDNCYAITRRRNSGDIEINTRQSGSNIQHEYRGATRWTESASGMINTYAAGSANFIGRWRYCQTNQSQNYEHHILGPGGQKLFPDYCDNNTHGIVWVGVVGTGTGNAYCQYRFSNKSSLNNLTLTHLAGGSAANSNVPYIVANSYNPAWKMDHPGTYTMVIDVMVTGGKSSNGTYSTDAIRGANP